MDTELSIPTATAVMSGLAARLHRIGAALLVTLPAVAALLFVPQLASPFIVPKSSLVIAVGGICCACMLWSQGRSWRARLHEPMTVALYLAFVWLGIVWLTSPLKYMGTWSLVLTLMGLLLFEATRSLIRGSEKRLFAALSASAALISAVTLAQFAFHFDPFRLFGSTSTQAARMRVFATLGNPDFVGELLAACSPAICSLSNRTVRWSLVALVGAGILCTGSRAALLAAAVAAMVWVAASVAIPRSRKLLVGASIAVVLGSALFASAQWNGRSLTTALQGRLTIWRVSLHRLNWAGTGVGTFSFVYLPKVGDAIYDGVNIDKRFITPERHAENDLVETIVETGPVGGMLCVLFLLLWSYAVVKNGNPHRNFALATVASIVTAAMFDFPLHRGETVALMAIALALPFGDEFTPREASRLRTIGVAFAALLACAAFALITALPVVSSRYSRLGAEAEERGELNRAENYFALAASVCPDNTDAVFSVTRVLAREEKYREAAGWSSIAKHYVSEPELWLLRARIFESMNENDLALAEMQNAQRMFPYSPLPKAEIEELLSNSPR